MPLSVAVMGSYYGSLQRPAFSIEEVNDSDEPKARRLNRILEQYTKALSVVERDLLARLALFPRGVGIEILGWIAQTDGEVAGALIGLGDRQLVRLLERLRGLGLVFRYETDGQIVYSAHPFLREFFRGLLGAKPEAVHESVRVRLAPSLEARPATKPSDPAVLDQYEMLIEQSLLAGRVQEAFELYWYGLGSYANLNRALGENARGMRILERFVPDGDFDLIRRHLTQHDQGVLVNDLGLFAKSMGELARGRSAFMWSRTVGG